MKEFSLILFLIACASLRLVASDYNQKMNVLDWAEEFNYTGLPLDRNWAYEVGYIRNNETQYYTNADSNNAYVANGSLVITAIKDTQGKVTSASINTLGKRHFFHGRLEIRAKVPTGKGVWPAIWAMGINRPQVSWPRCAEIDIMEYVGFSPYVFHNNVHTLGSKQTDVGAMTTSRQTTLSNAYSDWHIFAIERTSKDIKFFIDEKLVFTYNKSDAHPDYWYGLDQPHYLLLNLAIGGSWGGQQGVDESIFPAKYYIDYVRFYVATDSTRKYVSATGNDLNDGNSWATAYASVAQAISHCDCTSGGEVWIAQGTYVFPTTINMRKNLAIYGGFYGDETILDERHGNETIFSGDNKRRIFYNQSLDSTAILDTATITRGYADMGAGIYNDDKSAPVFKKCYFTANIATTNGGAIFNNHSNANFYDCRFESNRAANNGGGGVFNNYYSQAYYKKCIFKNNTAYKGAGAYDSHISPTTYDECLFESNSTTTDIGGGYFSTGGCITNISNSLFLSNKSTRGGAAYMASGETTFTNCTFYKNHAEGAPATIINNGKIRVINCTFAANDGDWGGTVYAQTNSTAKIVNSIFKNNTGTYLKQISSDDSSTFIASNCSIEGGLDGENIQSANPFLKDLKNNGGFTKTIALRSDSPARASGKTGIALDDCIIPISDARGKSRASPCTLGAYEIISAQSYDIWAQENLEAAQDKSACASPYPDNITNLQRYAQALSAEPIELSSTPLSSAVSAPCAIKNNKFEFRQAKDTTGFSVDVYYTSDLKNWQKTKATVIDSSFPDAQIMRAVAPEFSDNKNIFYKLIITKKDLTESNQ